MRSVVGSVWGESEYSGGCGLSGCGLVARRRRRWGEMFFVVFQ